MGARELDATGAWSRTASCAGCEAQVPLGFVEGGPSTWGMGGPVREHEESPTAKPGMLGSRRHRLGNGCGLLRGGGPGLGDAGDAALDQLGGTLQGAAGVGAGVLEGGKGDHEGKDAPSWIAGSDGDGGSGDVVLCSVHIFICFGLLCPFTKKRGDVRAASGSDLQRAPLVPAPAPKPRGEGQR